MRILCLLTAATLALWTDTYADTSSEIKKEAALKRINACMRRYERTSKACRSLDKNMEILTDVYRQGDKTVLPTLLRFSDLNTFLDEALVSDPEDFLSTVTSLPEASQQAVVTSLSGGVDGRGLSRQRFDVVRATLRNLPGSSPNRELANKLLVTLETSNACFLVDYFPAGTFADDFLVRWYSRELYALDEKPLWPLAPGTAATYRITILPAFSGPESVSLSVLPDGTGHIRFRLKDTRDRYPNTDDSYSLNSQQISKFVAALNHSEFWKMPTESSNRGEDGGEWILEAVQRDKYHVVARWCPNNTALGELAGELFELAHHKPRRGC